jgi:glucokinase
MARQVAVGVDVGGTKMLAVALDLATATTVAERAVPTPEGDAEQLIGALADLIDAVLRDGGGRPGVRGAGPVGGGGASDAATLTAVGVGLPGMVSRAGVLRRGPNAAGKVDVDPAAALARRFGVPVAVDNDGNLAALAEARLGAARHHRDMVFVGLGTGISAGFVLDGALLRGHHGFAGEPGHATVVANGARCACGRRGCWEAYASGEALGRQARQAVAAGRTPTLLARLGGEPAALAALDGPAVTAALLAGDPGAALVIREFAEWVGLGLANLAITVDLAMVVLGGSMIEVGEPLVTPIRAAFHRHLLYRPLRPGLDVVPAALGARAGAVGAALAGADVLHGD